MKRFGGVQGFGGSVAKSSPRRRLLAEFIVRSAGLSLYRRRFNEFRYKRVLGALRELVQVRSRRNSALDQLRLLLAEDIRWIMSRNGGGSLQTLLDDLFSIAGNCTAAEIIDVFPIALIDAWARREPDSSLVKMELAAWSLEQAQNSGDENACLLAANLATSISGRLNWIGRALNLSGVPGRVMTNGARAPFAFERQNQSESGPLITVIMSAFNAASTIEHSANSIINQTWRDIEFIIVDDASTDDTAEIISRLKTQDSRIKMICNDQNVGSYVSRNRALSISTGEFVTCHDADDIAHPIRLATQARALLNSGECIANQSNWIRVERDGHCIPTSMTSFIQENYSALLIRREVFDAIGFWDSVRTTADSEFRDRIKRRYGKSAQGQLPQILALGQFSSSTLTGVEATEATWLRYSESRMKYREAYKRWHAGVPRDKLYMTFPAEPRPFPVARSMVEPQCPSAGPQADVLTS